MLIAIKAKPQILDIPAQHSRTGKPINAQYVRGYILVNEEGIPFHDKTGLVPSWKQLSTAQDVATYKNEQECELAQR